MFGWRKKKKKRGRKTRGSGAVGRTGGLAPSESSHSEPDLSLTRWSSKISVIRKQFPGPAMVDVPLRIAMGRDAYAALVAHTKASLDSEVCGVLVGDICEDDEGRFLDVIAIIEGTSAEQGASHVTFTQETWDSIYATLDKKYSKHRIIGWYHSHPGFGVEFSEMDIFIQRNFFSDSTQIAVIVDPLSGQTAVAVNSSDGIQNIDRIWVDRRELKCYVPSRERRASTPATSGVSDKRLEHLEVRISQLVAVIDGMRNTHYRLLVSIGMLAAIAVAFWIVMTVYDRWYSVEQPPKTLDLVTVPVLIDGEPAYIGLQIVSWNLPPRLRSAYKQQIKMQILRELREEQKKHSDTSSTTAEDKGSQPQPGP